MSNPLKSESSTSHKASLQSKPAARYYASPQQERVWALMQADRSVAYLSQVAALIDGALDIGRLKSALDVVVNAHDILSTRFECVGPEAKLVQIVVPANRPAIEEVSLVDYPTEEQT